MLPQVHRYEARTQSARCQNLVRPEQPFVELLKERQTEEQTLGDLLQNLIPENIFDLV